MKKHSVDMDLEMVPDSYRATKNLSYIKQADGTRVITAGVQNVSSMHVCANETYTHYYRKPYSM